MNDAMAVRRFDLAAESVDAAPPAATLTVFWWRDLPLGMVASTAEELPMSPGTLQQHLSRFASSQRAARDPALGAPLAAGSEGRPVWAATTAAAAAVVDAPGWLERASRRAKADTTALSVVVCTRDRGSALAVCLDGLVRQMGPPGEIIVVDNSLDQNARALVRRFPGVAYVHEPRPGLSYARNAGLAACNRPLIAFTDDDVVPDAGWTIEIVAAFDNSDVEAVTGLVLPARLDTEAQRAFQFSLGGFGSSFVPMIYDDRFFEQTRKQGAHVWRIGAGANMAFRRTVFNRVGAFDLRLGAGASGCSEDSELWYRILAMGGSIRYEPRAVVYHDHRSDLPGLHRQVRAYMKGHVSALVAQGDRFGHPGNIHRIFKQMPRYFLKTGIRTVLNDDPARRRILWHEIAGWLSGLRYLVSPCWRRGTTVPREVLNKQRDLQAAR